MNVLAAAIIAAMLGIILTGYGMWRIWKLIWAHACHCTICKQRFMEVLNEHQDHGTRCTWKKIVWKSAPPSPEAYPKSENVN